MWGVHGPLCEEAVRSGLRELSYVMELYRNYN
jgi:hypothetical protein